MNNIREKYIPDPELADDLIQYLIRKGDYTERKIKETVLYAKPKTLIYWNKFLTVPEMAKYLIEVDLNVDDLGL